MFTHRGNPSGAPLGEEFQAKATNIQELNTSSTPFESSTAAGGETGSRKRGRDIHSLDRFKQVVFGERGFPQLHAMVTRNPILMYPPPNFDEVRRRSFEAKQIAEGNEAQSAKNQGEEGEAGPQNNGDHETDEAIRNYHHKQLDVFLHLVYEFNHMTFVKLPMNDTLQLLSRCGREAVAHVTEFEMHQRMKFYTRLRELRASHEERHRLRSRMMELEEVQAQAELDRAEAAQHELELMDFDHITGGDGSLENATSYSIDVVEKIQGEEKNFPFPDDTLVVTKEEADTMNRSLNVLEENVDDELAKHDPSYLTAELNPHSLSKPSLRQPCDDGGQDVEHL